MCNAPEEERRVEEVVEDGHLRDVIEVGVVELKLEGEQEVVGLARGSLVLSMASVMDVFGAYACSLCWERGRRLGVGLFLLLGRELERVERSRVAQQAFLKTSQTEGRRRHGCALVVVMVVATGLADVVAKIICSLTRPNRRNRDRLAR